jgi:serine/threonine protein kinase/WD40 repeat protein
MTPAIPDPQTASEAVPDDELVELLEEIATRIQRGEPFDIEELLRAHPRHASEVRRLLPTIHGMAVCGDEPASKPSVAGRPGLLTRLGDYQLVRMIGQGGMGVVYEAVQESLGRQVALKVLPPHATVTPQHRERFHREAQAAARLHHTHIVPVYGVGEHDGTLFYAMQFIDGVGLDALVRQRRQMTSPTGIMLPETQLLGSAGSTEGVSAAEGPPESVSQLVRLAAPSWQRSMARLAAEAADALHHAHQQGVLHRDVKPSNLLLDRAGTIWITDFGLAQVEGGPALTQTGDVVGTLRYMAPERFAGASDVRSDVYSLGLTLYELLTLRPAFDEPNRARLLERIAQGQPPPPRQVDPQMPRDLETIVLKAIEHEPRRRYARASDMAEDLRRFLADQPIQARPLGPLGRMLKWARRRPGIASLLLALGLTCAVLIGLGAWSYARIRKERDDKELQRQEEVRLRHEAEAAQARAETAAYRALRSETSALRLGRVAGWRHQALANLAELARMKVPERDPAALRDEAVLCLIETDLHQVPEFKWPRLLTCGLAFSPDGALLAIGGGSNVWLTQAGTGAVLQIFSAAVPPAVSMRAALTAAPAVQFHPDGGYLVHSSPVGGVRFQRLSSKGLPELPLPQIPHQAKAYRLAFDRRGHQLAIGWSDGRATIHDAATGRQLAELPILQDAGTHADLTSRVVCAPLALSPEGDRLVTVSPRGLIQVHALGEAAPRLLTELRSRGRVRTLAISPDGHSLASGSTENEVILWDLARGKEATALQGHTGAVNALAYHPDGRLLATASNDGTLRLWELPAGRCQVQLHPQGGSLAVAFTPDGQRLVVHGSGNASLYELGRWPGQCRLTGGPVVNDQHINYFALDPCRPVLAYSKGQRDVILVDVITGRELHRWSAGQPLGLMQLCYSPDGSTLAVTRGPEVHGCDPATGRMRWTVAMENVVYGLAFTSSGRWLAVGDRQGSLLVWDLHHNREVWRETSRSQNPAIIGYYPMAFLDHDTRLLTVESKRLTIREASTGRLLTVRPRVQDAYQLTSVSSAFLTVGRSQQPVELLTLPALEPAGTLQEKMPHTIFFVALRPDGRLAVCAREDRCFCLRDVPSGRRLLTIPALDRASENPQFSANGRWLVGREFRSGCLTVCDLERLHTDLAALGLSWTEP